MKLTSTRCLLVVAGLLLAAGLAPAAPAARGKARNVPKVDHLTQTKERIDALLKRRLNPEPLPALLPNPFQLPGTTAGTGLREGLPPDPTKPDHPVVPVEITPPTDSEALARYAAGLKISGAVRLNGQLHLIINQSPYKEGDLLLLNNTEPPVYLQITRLSPGELTLGLNDATLTLKVKN